MIEPLLSSESARAAELLVGSAWMELALVACVALTLRAMPRLSAAVCSRIWTAVLLAVILMPVLLCLRGGTAGVAEKGGVHAGTGWSYLLAGAWAVFAAFRLLQLVASALRLRSVARRALLVEANVAVGELIARSSRRVTMAVSGDVSRPSVAGFFRPQILLPMGLMEELSDSELEHVVLHELEHLRRWDDWTNLVQKVALAVFPLHPAMLWLDRQLCVERELACDDGVLRVTQARKAYAACLVRLAEDSMVRRGLSLALGLLGVGPRRSELSRRVHRILLAPATVIGRVQAGAVTALVLAGVVGGAVVLARSPRLISFGGMPEAVAQGGMPLATVTEPVRSLMPFRAVEAKVVMPRVRAKAVVAPVVRRPHVVRTLAVSRLPKVELRRVAMDEQSQEMAMPQPMVVSTAWEQSVVMPRMTMAVAREGDSLPSYAAVPVRGGWLLIQL